MATTYKGKGTVDEIELSCSCGKFSLRERYLTERTAQHLADAVKEHRAQPGMHEVKIHVLSLTNFVWEPPMPDGA